MSAVVSIWSLEVYSTDDSCPPTKVQ